MKKLPWSWSFKLEKKLNFIAVFTRMFTRFYYIIYKGIMTFKRYGYPIIELGGQVVGDLHKFYQENQCIENSKKKEEVEEE